MNPDVVADLKDLDSILRSVESVMDVERLRAEIAALEEESARPDLWEDQERAQRATSQ
ncbi:MAG: peptide chain release factor 2, partial [Sciscionella sp.]